MTEIIDGVDVSGCGYAEKSIPVDCSIDNCFCYENNDCYYKQLKKIEQENAKLKEKLEKIKEFITPLCCNNPLDCWMNKDEGTGDIYGCEGNDYKGCPNGFASCVLKIIEGAEDV